MTISWLFRLCVCVWGGGVIESGTTLSHPEGLLERVLVITHSSVCYGH